MTTRNYTPATTTLTDIGENGWGTWSAPGDFGGVYITGDEGIVGIRFSSVDIAGLTSLTSATITCVRTPNTYGSNGATNIRIRCEASAAPGAYTSGSNPINRTFRTAYTDVEFPSDDSTVSTSIATQIQDLIDTYGAANITSISVGFAHEFWGLANYTQTCVSNNGTGTAPALQIIYEDVIPVSGSAAIVSSAWSNMTDGYILVGGVWQQITNIQAALGEVWVNQVP
jgi:hypothetical protein